MWWADFSKTVPQLAQRLREEFEDGGVVLVGTVRADGSARISPVGPVFEAGHLYLDMMGRSRKALDLLRDPRVEVHAVPPDRLAPQYKVHGTAQETSDESELRHFAEVVEERFGWRPEPRHHLFRVSVHEAAWISYAEDVPEGYALARIWSNSRGYIERGPYASSDTES